jgi:hypothetical protein
MIKVKVEFIIETTDYGGKEFKNEIEKLLNDINPVENTLLSFKMYEIGDENCRNWRAIDWELEKENE